MPVIAKRKTTHMLHCKNAAGTQLGRRLWVVEILPGRDSAF
jgi:hypothetical protein